MINTWTKKDVEFLEEKCFKGRVTNCEIKIVETIKILLKEKPDLKILDYGCGTGRFLEILQKEIPDFNVNQYVGADTSIEMIKKARSKFNNISFFHISQNTPDSHIKEVFKPDVIVCLDVIQHQNSPYELIDSIFSYEVNNIFIEGWCKENGQELPDSEKTVILQTGSEFYENIYSYDACVEIGLANQLNQNLYKEDGFETVLFYLCGDGEALSYLSGISREALEKSTEEHYEKVIKPLLEDQATEEVKTEII